MSRQRCRQYISNGRFITTTNRCAQYFVQMIVLMLSLIINEINKNTCTFCFDTPERTQDFFLKINEA